MNNKSSHRGTRDVLGILGITKPNRYERNQKIQKLEKLIIEYMHNLSPEAQRGLTDFYDALMAMEFPCPGCQRDHNSWVLIEETPTYVKYRCGLCGYIDSIPKENEGK